MTHERNTEGLRPIRSKWKSTNKTKAIRVPEDLAEDILDYARKLDAEESDSGQLTESPDVSLVKNILNEALSLKANAGTKIKEKIREALEVIELL
ncbi:hypothetical protein PN466_02105 [Roseofilum reptotaenium CS-1145]|uniref:Uncharacterized protein n=1 Tax=Roseofilum reptotaenium AO1-A TaxID=1925591 RepID=A0A1L9QN72_9CYAN|nr:hypothetical protein [Roseofilum reptotaenium]MDB9515750.1 hypothetical protein [Roseofilum reptotaenium CS-1145]OJJ24099.1 hypothetical protein BI308_18635 [Roseofilum reptotaenium AO1-A]